MKIGVDLDDVLADWVKPYLAFHNQKFKTNFHLNDLTPHVRGFLDFFPEDDETIINSFNEFYSADYIKTAKPVAGSIQAVRELKTKGFDLHVVTSRPAFCHKATKEWLNKNFVNLFTEVHFADKSLGGKNQSKGEILNDLKIDYFIDDMLRFAYECNGMKIWVLLFDQPWNRIEKLPSNIRRVYNWPEIVKILNNNL